MIIRVNDSSGDSQYDLFFVVDPVWYDNDDAIEAVNTAIANVKDRHRLPGEDQFDDLVKELPFGIQPAEVLVASEEW